MSDLTRSPQDEPFDLAMLQADELLLDALGRGEPAHTDGADGRASNDEIGTMLAAWRMDLAAEIPQTSVADQESVPAVETVAAPAGNRRSNRAGRKPLRVRIAVAAAVIGVLVGGTAVAATNATPGSPLWSLSQVINPARAHRVAAEDALAQARQAIADKHPDQAARLLDKAAKLIADIRDPQQAASLRAELAEIEQLLINATTPGLPGPGITPGTRPSSSPSGAAHPSPAPTSTGGAGSGLPGHQSTSVPGTSQLPIPPLKSLLPTALPSLPLPGLGG
jgi:Anti-sigma-D factor RsdA to sigma factor binding region